jgi:thiamine-monophosphate kinase
MTSSTSETRLGEFELIRSLFTPLSRNLPGAVGLTDDVATLAPREGHEIVLKADAIVEDVHFLKSDPPGSIARKALRVNLSDFAAKSAEPVAYLMTIALPDWVGQRWLEDFAKGLEEDQSTFGVALAGGDTVRTPGALTIAITLTGFVPAGGIIRRAGASPGDLVFVTGTIGDAAGGLELLRMNAPSRSAWQDELVARYRLPEPRLSFGRRLRGLASASLDVSDGLIADLGHIADVSRVRIEINAMCVPISNMLQQLWGFGAEPIARAVTAGDDYEIAFTAPASRRSEVEAAALAAHTPVTEIGSVTAGEGVVLLTRDSTQIPLSRKGYTHF